MTAPFVLNLNIETPEWELVESCFDKYDYKRTCNDCGAVSYDYYGQDAEDPENLPERPYPIPKTYTRCGFKEIVTFGEYSGDTLTYREPRCPECNSASLFNKAIGTMRREFFVRQPFVRSTVQVSMSTEDPRFKEIANSYPGQILDLSDLSEECAPLKEVTFSRALHRANFKANNPLLQRLPSKHAIIEVCSMKRELIEQIASSQLV